MAYKNKKDYKKDKKYWDNSRNRNRLPAGYDDFKRREAAWLQQEKSSKQEKKSSNNNSNNNSNKSNDRGSGKFDDIKGALNEDSNKGKQAANDFKDKAVPTAKNDPRVAELEALIKKQQAAFDQKQSAWDSQLADLKLNWQGQLGGYQSQINEYQNQIGDYKGLIGNLQQEYQSNLGSLTKQYDKQVGSLEAQLGKYGIQITDLQGALSNSQQQYQTAEAARLLAENRADNLRNAFVPEANPTATGVSYGDDRQTATAARRPKDNRLSDLAILSGLGTESNPLAGLQLA